MSIKAGQILHVGSGDLVIDRIQTAGISALNVNEERLEELGNYEAIGTIRDIPDLTFDIESFDMGTEVDELVTGGDGTLANDTLIDFQNGYKPFDVISPYKGAAGSFAVVKGIAVPYLTLESVSYSFSLNDVATASYSLKGDSVFYVPGTVWQEEFAGDDITTAFNYTDGPSYKTVLDGVDHYVLGACLVTDSSGAVQRLRITDDYTATSATITMLTAPATGETLRIVYGSGEASTYNQASHTTTSPVGVRGRNITVTLDADGAGAGPITFTGVQSANVDYSVTLERDEEFGNPNIVGQDFDVPEVTGSISMKPADASALFDMIKETAGITSATEVINANEDPPSITLDIEVADPSTGVNLKTLYVPDAKFQMPAPQPSVGSKLEVDFAWASEGGTLEVWKRDRI